MNLAGWLKTIAGNNQVIYFYQGMAQFIDSSNADHVHSSSQTV